MPAHRIIGVLACLEPPADPPAAPDVAVLLGERARLLAVLRDVDAVRADADRLRGELVPLLRYVEARIRDARQEQGGG